MVQGQGVLQPDGKMMIEARMDPDAVGKAVVYIASLPLDTNVLFLTVMANMHAVRRTGISLDPQRSSYGDRGLPAYTGGLQPSGA